jgi:hypothetical protein
MSTDEQIENEKPIREYIKRENPHKYNEREYYRWYYKNVLKPKKDKLRSSKTKD